MSDVSRFWNKVTVGESGHCWPWMAGHNGIGYGRFFYRGRLVYAHRHSFELAKGRPIKDGMVLDHLCRNSRCCNPSHLEEVTQAENLFRARKKQCKRGHSEYVPDGRGNRRCAACHREQENKRYHAG